MTVLYRVTTAHRVPLTPLEVKCGKSHSIYILLTITSNGNAINRVKTAHKIKMSVVLCFEGGTVYLNLCFLEGKLLTYNTVVFKGARSRYFRQYQGISVPIK